MEHSKFALAGLMGWPVAHSRSPQIHNHWIAAHGLRGAYVLLPVAPANLGQALRALPVLGFAGCNLTIPHKVAAMALVDSVDPLARRIGAINTVVVQADGSLAGKRLFCELGSDGMTLDAEGNVYLTGRGVTVFDKSGKQIEQIPVPGGWTANVTFGGKDRKLLFITASMGIYGLKMKVAGAY